MIHKVYTDKEPDVNMVVEIDSPADLRRIADRLEQKAKVSGPYQLVSVQLTSSIKLQWDPKISAVGYDTRLQPPPSPDDYRSPASNEQELLNRP